jgi:hypothetical protein
MEKMHEKEQANVKEAELFGKQSGLFVKEQIRPYSRDNIKHSERYFGGSVI